MKNDKMAILTCLILVCSSIAGCLDDEGVEEVQDLNDQEMDDSMNDNNTTVENNNTVDNETVEIQTLGDVLVSTYHVQQLVSAIGGEHINVQIISPSNVPVHDFEPSAADLVSLMEADLFLYHGLNLEPWVGPTLEALGSDAPTAVQTHSMPSGEATLDYESMLIADLCEHLSVGPYENVELAGEKEHAEDVEIHAEHVTHSLSIPEDDEDNEDDHEDHDEDEDHEDHDGHDHAGAEVLSLIHI